MLAGLLVVSAILFAVGSTLARHQSGKRRSWRQSCSLRLRLLDTTTTDTGVVVLTYTTTAADRID